MSPPGTIGVGPSSAATGFFLGGIRPPRQVAAAFKLAERKSAEENEHVIMCDENVMRSDEMMRSDMKNMCVCVSCPFV